MASTVSTLTEEENRGLRLLVQLISHQAGLQALLERGFDYAQIAALMGTASKLGLVSFESDEPQVLEGGREFLARIPKGGPRFVSTADQWRVARLRDDEVYVPGKRSLRWLSKVEVEASGDFGRVDGESPS